MSAWVGVSETIVMKNARWNSEIYLIVVLQQYISLVIISNAVGDKRKVIFIVARAEMGWNFICQFADW